MVKGWGGVMEGSKFKTQCGQKKKKIFTNQKKNLLHRMVKVIMVLPSITIPSSFQPKPKCICNLKKKKLDK